MNCKHPFFLVLLTLAATGAASQEWKTASDSAALFNDQRNYFEAITHYQKAKNILKADQKLSDEYIQVCTALGVVYARVRVADSAAALFLEAKNTVEKVHGKLHKAYARATTFLANIYTNLARYKEAEKLFIEAKDIREQLYGKKETEEYAQTCNNLADLYRTIGLFDKAEPLAIEARNIRAAVLSKRHSSYAISTTALANLYRDMGQYKKAEPLYLEAKQVRQDTFGKVHPEYAASCNILADLYFFMGKHEQAEKLYLEAKDLREQLFKTKITADYAQSCNNLASLYLVMERYEEAEMLALQASEIWKEKLPKDHESHPVGFANLGNIYFKSGDYAKAEAFLLKARIIWENTVGKDHSNYIANSIALAKVYWCQKKITQAARLYSHAIQAQKRQAANFFAYTTEREKETFLQNVLGAGDEYYSFFYQTAKPENVSQVYDFTLLRRNIILSSSQQMQQFVSTEENGTLQNKYRLWISKKDKLAQLLSQPAPVEKDVKDLEEETGNLEKELAKSSTNFRMQQAQRGTSYQAIQQTLKPNEAAIEFVEFKYFDSQNWTDSVFYMALVLRSNNPNPSLIKLFEKHELEDLLLSTKHNKADKTPNLLYAGSSSLFNLFWQPLEEKLKAVSKVYFAPAGLLHQLSFAAITVGKRQLLSDKYQLVQVSTTASIVTSKNESISLSDKLLLYGGVEYSADSSALKKVTGSQILSPATSRSLPEDVSRGEKWDLLPGTKKEITFIETLGKQNKFIIKSLDGIRASEESLKSISGKNAPVVLHIATHGFFFPDQKEGSIAAKFATSGKAFKLSANPLLRSGLLLAGSNNAWNGKPVNGIEDGILTAYEVSNLLLPNTKLVVLSACETALGDVQGAEGVYGLQRAFKMAGAQNLLMSLWKVPDAETAEFMQEFYKHLFAKKPIADAFYKAQTTMKNKYRNQPYRWAAWVLVR